MVTCGVGSILVSVVVETTEACVDVTTGVEVNESALLVSVFSTAVGCEAGEVVMASICVDVEVFEAMTLLEIVVRMTSTSVEVCPTSITE
jgi:hypothetical protein